MAIEKMSSLLVLFFSFSFLLQCYTTYADRKPYIVYFGGHSHSRDEISAFTDEKVTNTHIEFLGSFLKSKEKANDAIFYSYTKYINGFAAILEEDEALEISKHPGVISVFPSQKYELHTTRSWEFLGLERNGRVALDSLWAKARFGEDTIIANLDSGVWPESESFKDDGLGPIPSRWKGICQNDSGQKFTCNRKLIGARYFNKGFIAGVGKLNSTDNSPRDVDGHGTHTLSTAGGSPVAHASIFGYADGTSRGGSPKARVAAYKVCWPYGDDATCFDSDVLAAVEAAIHDGVDVLSASIGGGPSLDYLSGGISIGSLHAVKHGITVVYSAGNAGPDPGSVTNVAPWVFTVAASTMDRDFPSYFKYNKKHIRGQSLSQKFLPAKKNYPIISSADAKAANATLAEAKLCIEGSLDPQKVKGKIVACLRGSNSRVEKGEAVLRAGGVALVLANDESTGDELVADAHVLPATHITYSDGAALFSYLNSTKSPYGYITRPKTQLGIKPAPYMAGFSSAGPNVVTPEILKPDITAPGVNVIAAWTKAASPSDLATDPRRTAFNVISGTSMSCPHIAGIVGLLRTLHPDWSPAAIRSAIMTSASVTDNTLKAVTNSSFLKATPFNYGSGHVRPNSAANPGLVYDLTTTDYMDFLCALGYNSTQVAQFGGQSYVCPSNAIRLEDLNYPSISVPSLDGWTSVTRTVKNVDSPGTYIARVEEPEGVSVEVKPSKLGFGEIGEEKRFELILKAKEGKGPSDYVFGSLVWSDGKHNVRSPIVVKSVEL